MPELYIITGSNGAGKSSIGPIYLPEHIQNNYTVFDGDKLFMQKQRELWQQGIKAHKEAKRIAFEFVEETFDQLVNKALKDNDNFVYEGHFTNDATWEIPKRFRENDYVINLFFLGVRNPELSELRVIDRAKEGGHYVPPLTIRDNFYGNLEKLNQHFAIIDNLKIIETSDTNHILLVHLAGQRVVEAIAYNELPEWFVRYLPDLCSLVK